MSPRRSCTEDARSAQKHQEASAGGKNLAPEGCSPHHQQTFGGTQVLLGRWERRRGIAGAEIRRKDPQSSGLLGKALESTILSSKCLDNASKGRLPLMGYHTVSFPAQPSFLRRTKALTTHSDKSPAAEGRVSCQPIPPQASGELWVFPSE